MARWNKHFGQSTSVKNRPLPAVVYTGKAIPQGLTLREVKKEMKALIDLMQKRYKEGIKKGVSYDVIKPYERRRWTRPGQIKTVAEGVRQIRKMWATMTDVGTVKRALYRQDAMYRKGYNTLVSQAWFTEKEFTYDDYMKFMQFYNLYSWAFTEAQFYQELKRWTDLSTETTPSTDELANQTDEQREAQYNMLDGITFKQATVEQIIDRWKDWQENADKIEKRELARFQSGEFVNGDKALAELKAIKAGNKNARVPKNPWRG